MADARELTQRAVEAIVAGKPEEALDWAGQATQIEPTYADAWIQVGIASSTLQRVDQADAAFRKAMELSPFGSKARYNFAVHRFQQGDYAQARQLAQDALRLDPNHASSKELLASLPQTEPLAESPIPPAQQSYYESWQPPQPVAPAPEPPRGGQLPWIDRLGGLWWFVGLLLCVLNLAGYVIVNEVAATMQGNGSEVDFAAMAKVVEANPRVSLGSFLMLGSWMGIVLFTLLDTVHRQRGYFWLAPMAVCSCMFGFLLLPGYILFVRATKPTN